MRLFIIIPGSTLLLIVILFIGLTRGTPAPEKLYPTPQNAEEFLKRGDLYQKTEQYEKALADYTQATKFNPTDATAYLGQASALSALNRHAEAIEKYQIVRQLDQQNGFITGLTDLLIESEREELQKQQ